MTRLEMAKLVQKAYDLLDDAETDIEEAKIKVKKAFGILEEIPTPEDVESEEESEKEDNDQG